MKDRVNRQATIQVLRIVPTSLSPLCCGRAHQAYTHQKTGGNHGACKY